MGGWFSNPRKGMRKNICVRNPLGLFRDHQLNPAFGANSNNPVGTSTPTRITGQRQIM
uniref:Truncated large S protein n=1 Tax=Hepatitis B virus TaxID=10407 RepID=D2X3Q9_HBV|nr:truncated large S protein [Hepatitis B virus]